MLPHTGGKATCIDLAICEVCGNEYGKLDPDTHPDDATDVWNEEEWHDNAGHYSKWSCCGKPKYPYEYHKWDDGICTVCGCICEHSISSPANCHERARCHTCGIWYGQIDPHNHDFYPSGTYTSGEKEPTCTEEGYTGDQICSVCGTVLVAQTEVPALGHDFSVAPEATDEDHYMAPTCTEEGLAYNKCSRCGAWSDEAHTIAALGHDEQRTVVAPTCTEDEGRPGAALEGAL